MVKETRVDKVGGKGILGIKFGFWLERYNEKKFVKKV